MSLATLTAVTDLIGQLKVAADDTESHSTAEERAALQTLADELLALQSIYCSEDGDNRTSSFQVVQLLTRDAALETSRWKPGCKIRLELRLPLDLMCKDPQNRPSYLRLSMMLPAGYPASQKPPQFQLLDRFLGPYKVDAGLFGRVLRTFLGSATSDGPSEWSPDALEPVLFEGCETVKMATEQWFQEQERLDRARQAADGRARAGEEVVPPRPASSSDQACASVPQSSNNGPRQGRGTVNEASWRADAVADVALARSVARKEWLTTEPLVDRKSTFVGHAVRLDRAAEVPLLLSTLLQLYPRLGKATHPLMRAWVCTEQSECGPPVVHRDCDDDGETAAGGRLARLLDALVSLGLSYIGAETLSIRLLTDFVCF